MNQEKARYSQSLTQSQERREEAAAHRKVFRVYAILFLFGVAVLLYWISLSTPSDYWYLGIVGGALMLPAARYYA